MKLISIMKPLTLFGFGFVVFIQVLLITSTYSYTYNLCFIGGRGIVSEHSVNHEKVLQLERTALLVVG